MNNTQRSVATVLASLALGSTLWGTTALSQTDLRGYYATQQPPALETLVPPGAERGNNAMAGGVSNLRLLTYTTRLPFQSVCRFYTDRLLPPASKTQAMGVEGDLKKQSGYTLDGQGDAGAATFCQRTSAYSVSAFVHRGPQDQQTQVTLVYGQN